jgi:hypothetical protein
MRYKFDCLIAIALSLTDPLSAFTIETLEYLAGQIIDAFWNNCDADGSVSASLADSKIARLFARAIFNSIDRDRPLIDAIGARGQHGHLPESPTQDTNKLSALGCDPRHTRLHALWFNFPHSRMIV